MHDDGVLAAFEKAYRRVFWQEVEAVYDHLVGQGVFSCKALYRAYGYVAYSWSRGVWECPHPYTVAVGRQTFARSVRRCVACDEVIVRTREGYWVEGRVPVSVPFAFVASDDPPVSRLETAQA